MSSLVNYPILVFAISIVVLWYAARIGARLRKSWPGLKDEMRDDFSTIMSAILTLLGLLIGFTFSMAVNRYDQRKSLEEAEANAIGTEYARATLLPPVDSEKVRAVLKRYLDERVLFYTTRNEGKLREINQRTDQLQSELWASVQAPGIAQPSMMLALVVSGMNDVLNSQGYTQAAWWNRVPLVAWVLMGLIAIVSNVMTGICLRQGATEKTLLWALPFVFAVSFFLIADVDAPRSGIIHVRPDNLISLVESLKIR